jgi:imidazole glycerol phosphate synthase subunit HisF
MGKITKYSKFILVTRSKSDHHVCLEKTRQMMKNVTMLNKKCSLPFCKGGGVHTIDGTKFFMECPLAIT